MSSAGRGPGIVRPTCPVCLQDVGVALTCWAEQRPGVTYYGRDVDADWYRADVVPTLAPRCRGCGVAVGGVHHPFCVVAVCDTCGEQRLLCPCDDDIEPL